MNPLAWMDVISTDIDRTLGYYAEVFGWSSEELPIDHGDGYRLVRSGDAVVAGAEQVSADRNLDPVWTVMVECDDARPVIDASVASGAAETFSLSPMLDLGRIAMVRDPWGATLGVWEPGAFRPSATADCPGRLIGAVLTTPDVEGSIRFHREMFGWRSDSGPDCLDAGVPVFVEASAGAACWTPILSGPASHGLLDETHTPPRLAEAGLARCADPMGAAYYVSRRPPTPQERQPSARHS